MANSAEPHGSLPNGQQQAGEEVYYTARHLLQALLAMDERLLDAPLLLVHGKELHKPNLIHGFVPALTPCAHEAVELKKPSLLTLAQLT